MKTFKPTEEQLHRFCGSWSVPVKYVNVLTGASPCSTQWLIDDCYRRVRKYRDDIALMIEEAKGKKIEELDLEFWRDSRDFWSAILADCTPPKDIDPGRDQQLHPEPNVRGGGPTGCVGGVLLPRQPHGEELSRDPR